MANHGPNGQESKADERVHDFERHHLGFTRLRNPKRVPALKFILALTAFIGVIDAPQQLSVPVPFFPYCPQSSDSRYALPLGVT